MTETTSDTKDLRLAQFLCSAHEVHQRPLDEGSEVAFAGRSNVGKSSAINVIANQVRLARTSKKPGRTQQIVFFGIDKTRRLVDLPGYGYAKVPREIQRHWEKTVRNYLENRISLRGLVLLIDVRRGLTSLDNQLLDWCTYSQLPVHVLLTKSDKLSRSAASHVLLQTRRKLPADLITIQLFSSLKKLGIEEARKCVLALLSQQV